jgi:hypothetical protein
VKRVGLGLLRSLHAVTSVVTTAAADGGVTAVVAEHWRCVVGGVAAAGGVLARPAAC